MSFENPGVSVVVDDRRELWKLSRPQKAQETLSAGIFEAFSDAIGRSDL